MRERPAIDSHRLWQHGPLLLFENHGDFTLSHAERVTGVYEEVVASEGFLLLLLDLADSGQIEPSTRRHMAQWAKTFVDRICIAVVDGSVVLRTTYTLIMAAARVLSGQAVRTLACRDRATAYAWLQEQHAELQSRLANKPVIPLF